MANTDVINWDMRAQVIKYEPPQVRAIEEELQRELTVADVQRLVASGELIPDDVVDVIGNAVVNVGKTRLADLIIGSGATAFNGSRAVTGVGNGTAATTGSETALVGASQYYQAPDGAPTNTSGVVSASTTFTGSNANFAWEEWCWAIATAAPVASSSFTTATTSGVMLNRKAQTLGTKASGAVWTLVASVSVG